MNLVKRTILCNVLFLTVIMLIFGCSKTSKDIFTGEHIYGIQRETDGNFYITSIKEGGKKIKLSGRSSFFMKDNNDNLWVPYEREYDYSPSHKVDLINQGKIIKTITVENRPIKVVEGKDAFFILCEVNGEKGKVIVVNNSNFDIIAKIDLEGNLTDAILDDAVLYITSDNLVNNVGSYIYKLNLNNYEVNSVQIQTSRRINSIQEHGEYIYVGVLAYSNREQSNILKLRKSTLEINKEIEVEFSPLEIEKFNSKLYILHFSYNTEPIWGGVISIFDLNTETVKKIDIPLVANHILIDNGKIYLSSSFVNEFCVFNLENDTFKSINSVNILKSNLINLNKEI